MGVRIILCSYNGEKYIQGQLESILRQTEEAFRLSVSDDCSSDRTAEIAEQYAVRFPDRVSFTKRKTKSGSAAKHFLTVLKELLEQGEKGEIPEDSYVMFSDQDDLWHSDKVKKTLERMKQGEEEYGAETPLLVHCDMRVTGENGEELCPSYVRYQKMSPERNSFRQLLVQNNVTGGAMMMNRALWKLIAHHPLPEHAVMHDQWIALAAAAFGKVIFLKEALYDYRQHGDNVLGAAKGSFVREVLDRLGLFREDGKSKAEMDQKSREVYTALFRQAMEFGRQYGGELSKQELFYLKKFTAMRKMSRPGKIYTILRYGFTFNTLHRTAGECLFL